MTGSQIPSGENFWGKAAVGGGAIAGGHLMHSRNQKIHHNKMGRIDRMQKALTAGEINPRQFLLQYSVEESKPEVIKEQLVAWGGTWNGVSFDNPNTFDVVRTNPGELLETPRYKLAIATLGEDLPRNPQQGNAPKSPQRVNIPRNFQPNDPALGRRGGATTEDVSRGDELDASETLAIESLDTTDEAGVTCGIEQWSPANRIYPIAAPNKKNQGHTFLFEVPRTPLHQTLGGSYVIAFAVTAVALWLMDWVPKRFQRLNPADNSLSSSSKTRELAITLESMDPIIKSSLASDSMLNVLTSFYDKKITKTVAISLLRDYHNKTEEEALALLEEQQSLSRR